MQRQEPTNQILNTCDGRVPVPGHRPQPLILESGSLQKQFLATGRDGDGGTQDIGDILASGLGLMELTIIRYGGFPLAWSGNRVFF